MGFSIDNAAVEASASHVETVKESVDGQIVLIRDLVEGSRSHWQGSAQAAFASLMERYDASARKQSEALATIVEKIRSNNQGYDDTEQQVLQSIHAADASATLDM